ncbi:MAG: hypothetical protein ACRYG2_30040, partial [Janthinobacterium lividum]
ALAHVAAELAGPLTQQAVDALTPYAQQAAEAVAPYAQQAADAVAPYAQLAADAVAPYMQQAADAVGPYAQQLAPRAQQAAEAALDAAKDAFTGAREKVTTDYLPAVGAAAATAAASASPLVAAATERGKALVQSTRSEPAVVLPPPKKKRGWFTTVAVVAAAAGATYVVVRKLVGDKGSQWQTARPTTPYESPVSAEAGVATPTAEAPHTDGETEVVASTTSLYGTVGSADTGSGTVDTDDSAIAARTENVDEVASSDEATVAPSSPTETPAVGDGSGVATPTGSDAGSGSSASAGSGASDASSEGTFGGAGASTPFTDKDVDVEVAAAEERVYEEPESAVWASDDAAMGGGPDAHPERYDMAGAYVGVEPPAGFTIKGNERSMKYHLPDSNSYGRTIAQVWFSSEEAAQQAGFSRAEH